MIRPSKCFNDSDRITLIALLGAEALTTVEQWYEMAALKHLGQVYYGDPQIINEGQRARNNFLILKQGLLHRSERLFLGAIAAALQGSTVGIALMTRGFLEAVAQLGYFCDRLDALQKRNISFEAFNTKLAETLMGAAHDLFNDAPKPLNIMLCIEKADRQFNRRHKSPPQKIMADSYLNRTVNSGGCLV